MSQQTDADNVYREVAKFVENTTFETLTAYSEISFTPVIGAMQYFPRPSSEARAAERGLSLLREQVDEAVAILYALAAAVDNRLPVPDVLAARVQPYVEIFLARKRQPVSAADKKQSVKKSRPRRRGRQK